MVFVYDHCWDLVCWGLVDMGMLAANILGFLSGFVRLQSYIASGPGLILFGHREC